MHQKTGNWAGKTVACARGSFRFREKSIPVLDLPGTYSLQARSAEEIIARDRIAAGTRDLLVVVCDASCLERGLRFLKQIRDLGPRKPGRTALCVNLCDEAERNGIRIDFPFLAQALNLPVIPCAARDRRSVKQLKEKLASEGLFDSHFKREINRRPSNIAVVTSPTGAAVRDIIKIAGQRNSSVSITVIPALVQGDMAAESIVEGIRLANRLKKADTIIVGRGGGSIEDLWAFNDERVARAIFSSEIPVISAVGHETDFTIADFVADLRASTPSNAAELAVADINEDKRRAETLIIKLEKYAGIALKNSRDRLKRALESPAFAYPLDNISDREETIKALMSRLKRETEISVRNTENCVAEKVTALEALSPLKVLARGYSYTENANGKVVTSVDDVQNGDSIFVTLKDGRISASVEDKVMF